MQTCTFRDLVAEGAAAAFEADPTVARLKSSAGLVKAIEPAVKIYEEPPTAGITVETPWSDIWLSAADWAEAFDAVEPGTPHNEARERIWEELVTILMDKHEARTVDGVDGASTAELSAVAPAERRTRRALTRAWPDRRG